MSALRDALRDLPDPVFADVLESDDAYLVVLDLPGVDADGLDVSTGAGMVTISASRDVDVPAAFTPVDRRRSSSLEFRLPLPPDAATEGAEGSIDRGVLELTLPKTGSRPSTTVPINEA